MNIANLSGEIIAPVQQIQGTPLFQSTLRIIRKSGISDEIPVLMKKEYASQISMGDFISLEGKINSRSIGGHLLLGVYIQRYKKVECPEDENYIYLEGYLCKQPIYRVTPFGREIADVLIAVQRHECKSDYIPGITWGRNAVYTGEMPVGSKVRIKGRMQSREYQKQYSDETVETKTAYEVSISDIEVVELPQRKE